MTEKSGLDLNFNVLPFKAQTPFMTSHQPDIINWFRESSHDTHQGAYNYLDLCDFDLNGNAIARNIIEQLLKTNVLNFETKVSKDVDESLFQLMINNKNTLAYSGYHSLGLGFPIVKLKNTKTKQTTLTPLFIWPVKLVYQNLNNLIWTISYDQNDQIRINYALQRYLKDQFKVDLDKLAQSIISDKKLNTISLSKICYELSSAMGQKEDFFIENIQAIDQNQTNNILCSGVIGNFFAPIAFSKSKAKIKAKTKTFIKHPFSTTTLDAFQESAFNKFWQHNHTQVIADNGTGKSSLLHYTLNNALSNGLTSLVIVDSIGRIKKIRNEFSANGLDHLILDITDPKKDLIKIIQALNYKSSTPKEDFDPSYFNYLCHLCQRHKDRLDLSFQVLEQPLFDKASWSEIVGNYLNYNRIEKQDLLDNQLNARDFTFHPTEYLSLKEAVKTSESIYQNINNLKHHLHILHPDIFLEKTCTEAKAYVVKQLELFYEKFDKLHHRYILKQQDYAKDLYNIQETFFQEALLKIEGLKDQIEDNRILYGNEFEDSGLIQTGKLKVYGVFSGKHKNILQARNIINDEFKLLRNFLMEKTTDQFEISENIDSKAISKVYVQLNNLEDQMYEWKDSIPEQLQEVLQRLNTKSVDSSLDYEEQINELEYTLDMNIEELNTSGLYLQPLQNKMLTIPMRQLFIQEIIDQLQNTKNHLKEFDAFYEWQRHWLLLPEIHRKLLAAIIKVNPKNWKTAFKSWYFHQRLKADFHFKMPRNEKPLVAFEAEIQKLQDILPIQIRQEWKQKSKNKLSVKALSKLSLQELFNEHFEVLTQQFPVIVISDQVAAQLINHTTLSFDLAFYFKNNPEIEHIDIPLSQIASRSLTFCQLKSVDQPVPGTTSFLNNVHKKTPYPIFNFTNSLIYQCKKNLTGFSSHTSSPFQVNKLSGQFRRNINTQEADKIINDLIHTASQASTLSPKIAIITTTIAQRDYIAKKIMAIKVSGHSQGEQIKKLEANGLRIFHLNEKKENSFDQIFFSVGIHNFTHNANELLTFLNSKTGYQRIEGLISSNYSKVHIYHSISDTDIDRYLSYKIKKSPRLLACWIKFATAFIAGNQKGQKAILDDFLPPNPPDENKLISEIANELIPYIGKNRIQLNGNHMGIALPLLILPYDKKGKPIAIINDGALDSKGTKSYLWNINFLRLLKSQGLTTITIWSANWFEYPALEARRLASAILKMDKEQITQ